MFRPSVHSNPHFDPRTAPTQPRTGPITTDIDWTKIEKLKELGVVDSGVPVWVWGLLAAGTAAGVGVIVLSQFRKRKG